MPDGIRATVADAGWIRCTAVTALAIAVVAAGWAPPHAAAARPTLDAGALQAKIKRDPWRLRFTDAGGREVLVEAPGTGTGGTGALGFRTGEGWFRATRVISTAREGKAYIAALETTDPAGRRIEARLSRDGGGVIALDATVTGGKLHEVTATGVSFDATRRERYLGFGERSNAVDQRGNVVENYVSDGPWTGAQYPIGASFVPDWGFRPREDATYFPMPWLLSSRGYGVLVDNPEESRHRLATDSADAWSVEVDAPRLRLRVLAGPRPADALRRLTRRVGRQPKPFAPWVFGAWFHAGQENQPPVARERAAVEAQRSADVPVSTVETHLRYLPCGGVVGRRGRERERTAFFHRSGLATVTYYSPEICVQYQPVYGDAVSRDVLLETELGDPYVYDVFVGDAATLEAPISQIDFTAPGAEEFYAELLSQAVEDGHDGWMEDFGEYTPPDSVAANGMSGRQMHNLYPVFFHRAGFEFARAQSRPIVRHVRSGWTGVHPYAQIVWGGDPTTVWDFDGLQSSVRQALTMGLSGISIWGSDIGGFFTIASDELTPELLTRWVQFGAVSGVMRTKHGGVAVPAAGERVQVYDPDQIANWRRYTKLRTQLYPYIAAADAFYRRTGMPLMRHLALRYPGDPQAVKREDEFMFGPDLLAAPVLEPGATERELYLPPGRWVELWRAVEFRKKPGDLALRRASPRRGGRSFTARAKLDELPLMVRAGALLPLLPANVDTLANRYDTANLTSLRERKRTLEVLAFPRGRSGARVYENERLVSREEKGKWRLRIRGKVRRRWTIDASLATLRDPFHPRCVEVDGKPLSKKRWSYSERKRRLRIAVRAKRARIVARERC
jgi:alpha-glucosidase (family GH31 glycosyl hydrolase)